MDTIGTGYGENHYGLKTKNSLEWGGVEIKNVDSKISGQVEK